MESQGRHDMRNIFCSMYCSQWWLNGYDSRSSMQGFEEQHCQAATVVILQKISIQV